MRRRQTTPTPLRTTHLDDELFAVVEQYGAGVLLVQLHLLQCVSDHRILAVDQPQPGDVDEIVTEVLQVHRLQVLPQSIA